MEIMRGVTKEDAEGRSKNAPTGHSERYRMGKRRKGIRVLSAGVLWGWHSMGSGS